MVQGQRAWSRGDFTGAKEWFRLAMELGEDAAWSQTWIAYADGYNHDTAAFEQDLTALRKMDGTAAEKVIADARRWQAERCAKPGARCHEKTQGNP